MSRTDSRSANPLAASLEKLREEMDHLLEAAWSNGERALGAIGLGAAGKAWVPEVDVVETDEFIHVFVDLPGMEPQAVDVSLVGNMLTIKGERPAHAPHPSQVVHQLERRRGTFSRSVPMPAAVNADNVSAEARNGTLTIRLAKQQSAKARHIPISHKPVAESTVPTA